METDGLDILIGCVQVYWVQIFLRNNFPKRWQNGFNSFLNDHFYFIFMHLSFWKMFH